MTRRDQHLEAAGVDIDNWNRELRERHLEPGTEHPLVVAEMLVADAKKHLVLAELRFRALWKHASYDEKRECDELLPEMTADDAVDEIEPLYWISSAARRP